LLYIDLLGFSRNILKGNPLEKSLEDYAQILIHFDGIKSFNKEKVMVQIYSGSIFIGPMKK
jgi:hypothetical protein